MSGQLVHIQCGTKQGIGDDGDFGGGVPTFGVKVAVGFGNARFLRLAQCRIKTHARMHHLIEDEIGRARENAFNGQYLTACQLSLHKIHRGQGRRCRTAHPHLYPMRFGGLQQLLSMQSQSAFGHGNNVHARMQGMAHVNQTHAACCKITWPCLD